MPSLYELSGQRLQLQQKLDVLNLDEETINDTLEGESTELEKKIQDYGFVILNRHSFANAIQTEIDRLQMRLNAEKKRIEHIESWVLKNMQGCGITKIECPSFSVAVQPNPPSVEVVKEGDIPPEYMRTPEPKPPVPAPDKRKILDALKSGKDVPGCKIKQASRLVIK